MGRKSNQLNVISTKKEAAQQKFHHSHANRQQYQENEALSALFAEVEHATRG